MFHVIGETAGEIWQLLKSEGPLSLSAIAERSSRPKTTVYMGVGWLARENKLEFTESKRGIIISLK